MGLLGRFQKRRKPKKDERQSTGSQPLDEGNEIKKTQEEIEALELHQRQQEEAFRKQQEERARELEKLDAQVDNVLSSNSEEFLKNVKQPGGQ